MTTTPPRVSEQADELARAAYDVLALIAATTTDPDDAKLAADNMEQFRASITKQAAPEAPTLTEERAFELAEVARQLAVPPLPPTPEILMTGYDLMRFIQIVSKDYASPVAAPEVHNVDRSVVKT